MSPRPAMCCPSTTARPAGGYRCADCATTLGRWTSSLLTTCHRCCLGRRASPSRRTCGRTCSRWAAQRLPGSAANERSIRRATALDSPVLDYRVASAVDDGVDLDEAEVASC